MKLQLYNSKTMKLEILTLDQCEPGIIYLVPKVIRCKDCECIIQHYHGWKCPNCEKQWSFSDYAGYFGKLEFGEPEKKEPYKLRWFCRHCEKGDIQEQIQHRVEYHSAVYIRSQRTLRYLDHILDVIPPDVFRKASDEFT